MEKKEFAFKRLHKDRPEQFKSVTRGTTNRLQKDIQKRRSSRFTIFDNVRNLETLKFNPVSEKQRKLDQRKQQLNKWKEEKEEKRRQAAASKKKPFLLGAAHSPLKGFPPLPSTSGRVTRSQTRKETQPSTSRNTLQQTTGRNTLQQTTGRNTLQQTTGRNTTQMSSSGKQCRITKSFAPKNAGFRAPIGVKAPELKIGVRKVLKKQEIDFAPILPTVRNTRSRCLPTGQEATQFKFKQNTCTHNGKAVESSSEESPVLEEFTNIMASKTLPLQFSSDSSPEKIGNDAIIITNKELPIVPRSESKSEEHLRSPKSPMDLELSPLQIEIVMQSPCVTLSRGKNNSRKEMKWKLAEGILDFNSCADVDNLDHFRQQHAAEIARITEMCDTWDKILEQTVLPEAAQEAVLSAVGQARLLMSQKLQQFATLVERSARPEPGAAQVTSEDLQGFWDMVFMQVENVDLRFKNLEELRARGWVEPPVETKKKTAVKPTAAKKTKKPAATSRIKDMIAAEKRALKKQAFSVLEPVATSPDSAVEKTFNAGFFWVRSPVRPSPSSYASPAPRSLLQAVLSNEASKASASKGSASFAILRASTLAKNVEMEGISILQHTPTLTPINMDATPGRSILKSANQNSGTKLLKVVLFQRDLDSNDDSAEEKSDEERPPIASSSASGIEGMAQLETDEIGTTTNNIEKSVHEDIDNNVAITRSRRKTARYSPVLAQARTRKQRKTLENSQNPEPTPEHNKLEPPASAKRSSRKKKAVEKIAMKTVKTPAKSREKQTDTEPIEDEATENASSRKAKQNALLTLSDYGKPVRRRSSRMTLQEVEPNILEDTTPKRYSSRRSTTGRV